MVLLAVCRALACFLVQVAVRRVPCKVQVLVQVGGGSLLDFCDRLALDCQVWHCPLLLQVLLLTHVVASLLENLEGVTLSELDGSVSEALLMDMHVVVEWRNCQRDVFIAIQVRVGRGHHLVQRPRED